MEKRVLEQVRSFNRSIAVQLNVFNRYALGTEYSLVESRIIVEIGRDDRCTANKLAAALRMDKSYLSRILAKLEAGGLLDRLPVEEDGRKKQLSLTKAGKVLYGELDKRSDQQVEAMLEGIRPDQIEKLLESMQFIQKIIGGENV